MIWDKLFWLWFALTAAFAILLFAEDPSTLNLVYGSMLVGLGLIKLAGEAGQPRIDGRILRKLRR
jgi:hypothetical protein